MRAFTRHDKLEVLRLLPLIDQPHTVRDEDCLGGPFRGFALLHLAAWNGWLDICKVLIEKYSCQPDDTDGVGRSVLHFACLHGHVEVVKYLLTFPSVSANLTHCDSFGRSAMEFVTKSKYAILSMFSSYLESSMELRAHPFFKIFLSGTVHVDFALFAI